MHLILARLIIAVRKWGMIVSDQDDEDDEAVISNPQATKCATASKNYSMFYWRQGILVMYEAGSFVVESFKDIVRVF